MENKKDIIAEQFKKHFKHFGFKKTSVDTVAKELNFSKKTIYQFFNSKEKIFYYIISKIANQFKNNMEKKLEVYSSYQEKIENLLGMIFSETRKWLKKNDAFEFKYKFEISSLAFKDAYFQLLVKLISGGMDNKEFHHASPEIKAQFIQGIITESMKIQSINNDLKLEDEVIQSVIKILT